MYKIHDDAPHRRVKMIMENEPLLSANLTVSDIGLSDKEMVGEAKTAISGGTMSSDERSHQGEDLRSTEERLLAEPIVSDIGLSDKEMVGEAKAAISGGMMLPDGRFQGEDERSHQGEERLSAEPIVSDIGLSDKEMVGEAKAEISGCTLREMVREAKAAITGGMMSSDGKLQGEDLRSTEGLLLAEPIVSDIGLSDKEMVGEAKTAITGRMMSSDGKLQGEDLRSTEERLSAEPIVSDIGLSDKEMVGEAKTAISGGIMLPDGRFQGEDERSHQGEDLRSTEEWLSAEPIVSDIGLSDKEMVGEAKAAISGCTLREMVREAKAAITGRMMSSDGKLQGEDLRSTEEWLSADPIVSDIGLSDKEMVGEAKAAISGGMMSSDQRFQGEDERSHQGKDLRSTEERLLADPIVSDIGLSDKEMVGEAKTAISGGMMLPDGGFQEEDERFHQGGNLRSTEERLLAEPIVSDIGLSDKEMVGEAKTAISGGMMSSDGRFQGEDERSHQGEDLRPTEEQLLADPIVSDIGLSDKEMVGEAKAAISGGVMSSDEKFHQVEDRLSLLTSPTAAEKECSDQQLVHAQGFMVGHPQISQLNTSDQYMELKSTHESLVVEVKVSGIPIEAVVDSGAHITVLQRGWVEQWAPHLQSDEVVNLNSAAAGGVIPATLRKEVDITLNSVCINMSIYVADINDDCILGLDWMRATRVRLDFEHGILEFKDQRIVARYKRGRAGKTPLAAARIVRNTLLKPNSESMVWVSTPISSDGLWMFQECCQEEGIMIPNSIHSEKIKHKVTIVNCSGHHIRLRAGNLVGTLQPVSSLDVSEEEDEEEKFASIRKLDREMLPPHMESMFAEACGVLEDTQKEELHGLLLKNRAAFSMGDMDLGTFKTIKHHIHTGAARPVKQRMRRTPLGYALEEKKHLDLLLAGDVIEPSESEWASPSVLVRKRDGTVRWCIDMRRLNDVTTKDSFPLPLIEECIDSLDGCVFFSSLDMASGYYQLEVSEEDREKTAFVTKYGLYQFKRMPFGLCNAPATFSRAISLVLHGMSWTKVIAFLDDIMVLGKSFEEHYANLAQVLQRFCEHGLKLKPRKCNLFQRSVLFLGKRVSEEGIEINPANIEKVKTWPIPRCKKEVEAFLGFVNYHREHIIGFAGTAQPLYQITGKEDFHWKEEQQLAFESLKKCMTSTPVLAYPNASEPFVLDTDASNFAVGAELIQIQGGCERVIGYDSMILDKCQRKYCTTRKELLAVVVFTRKYRHYLLGRPFHLRTDHNSLIWLMGFKNIEGQLSRWLEELSTYDMRIVHRPGKEHGNADGMSRIPGTADCYTDSQLNPSQLPCASTGCSYCSRIHQKWERFTDEVDYVVPLSVRAIRTGEASVEIDDGLKRSASSDKGNAGRWLLHYSFLDVEDKQKSDTDLADIRQWLVHGITPSEAELAILSPAAKHWWLFRDQLSIVRGVLYFTPRGEECQKVIVAPKDLQNFILENCHDSPTAGHMGIIKTLMNVKHYATWYQMQQAVTNYVRGCETCNKQKTGNRRAKAAQTSYHVGSPMERVHIDILGPISESNRGNRYVLVMVDQFTKWVECCALPDQSAETVARSFVDNIVARLGCPFELHSDQGRNFESNVVKEICRLLEISKTRTTPYRPQANGQVERFNRTIMQILRCFMQEYHGDWDVYLPLVAGAIRSSVNRSTGFTPNYLMLGREVMRPLDLMLPKMIGDVCSREANFVTKYQTAFQRAHEIARQNLKAAQFRQKRDYDVKLKQTSYEVGDIVLRQKDAGVVGVSKKLLAPWSDPWIVAEVISATSYRIVNRNRSTVVHHDKLKKCTNRSFPLWVLRRRQRIIGGEEQHDDADLMGEIDETDLPNLFDVGQETIPETLAAEDSDSGEVELDREDTAVADTNTNRGRYGRTIKPPARWGDYELW